MAIKKSPQEATNLAKQILNDWKKSSMYNKQK